MLRGIRVFVVDDDRDAAEITLRALEEAAADVTAVSSAAEALLSIRAGGDLYPHVIVTDIGMPDIDGYRFLEELRALPADGGGAIPMIALSAYASRQDRRRADHAGFEGYLSKPFEPETLVALVIRVVGT